MNSYQIKNLKAICKDVNGHFLKYRNIKNSQPALKNFAKFATGKKILYANFYDAITNNYVGRKYYYQILKP